LKRIFQDAELQGLFERDGYVVVPWMTSEAVADIKSAYDNLHPEDPKQGFYSTTFSEDPAFKQGIFERVEKWYAPSVAHAFKDYKKLGAGFLCKAPGETGHMPIHQDWTVTFEAEGDFSATIWMPLQDVNASNGAIKVLPGSHRYDNALRGPSLPVIWKDVFHLLEPRMKTLEMKAGEAFIFDHSLLHSSHLNQTEIPRLAVTYGLAPEDAPLIYYWKAGKNRVERLYMGDELFMRYHNIGERPTFGVSQGYFTQDLSPVTEEECHGLLKGEIQQIERPLERSSGPHLPPSLKVPLFRIFEKQEQNLALHEQGYVVTDFLSESEVEALRKAYSTSHDITPERFYASSHAEDVDFRRRMHQEIEAVLAGPMERDLPGAKPLGGSFIAKPKGQGGILPPHADWNISDEQKFRSYNLWIPLVDTTVDNGAVFILPGSHQWLDSLRGPGIPNPFQPIGPEIWDAMQPLEMKAGQALLYDHRLVHASPENKTDELRLACVYGLLPQNAEMRYYCMHEGLVKAYRSTVDFFLTGNPEEGPGELEFLEVVDYSFPSLSLRDMKRNLGEKDPVNEEIEATMNRINESLSFWQTYTPKNIFQELSHRIKRLFKNP